jgi:hypothetical protein
VTYNYSISTANKARLLSHLISHEAIRNELHTLCNEIKKCDRTTTTRPRANGTTHAFRFVSRSGNKHVNSSCPPALTAFGGASSLSSTTPSGPSVSNTLVTPSRLAAREPQLGSRSGTKASRGRTAATQAQRRGECPEGLPLGHHKRL